jgi:sRNA-binding carbon storage regulator CsrA
MHVKIDFGPRTIEFKDTFDPNTYEVINNQGISSKIILRSAPAGYPVLFVGRWCDKQVTLESLVGNHLPNILLACKFLRHYGLPSPCNGHSGYIINSCIIDANGMHGFKMITNNEIEICVIPICDNCVMIAYPSPEKGSTLEEQIRNFIESLKISEASAK